MAQVKFANNVSTQLTKPAAKDSTILEVRSLTLGLTWPELTSPGDYFLIVIDDLDTSRWEILKCTNVEIRSNETVLTVERGLEGTIASDFNAGAIVENRLTAGTINNFATGVPDILPISRGGTEATTPADARVNLEIYSKAEVDAKEVALQEQINSSMPPDATIDVKGIVQLSNAVDSDSEILAATSKAVKTTHELATKNEQSVTDLEVTLTASIKQVSDIITGAQEVGQLGPAVVLSEANIDLNTMLEPGCWWLTSVSTATNLPDEGVSAGFLEVFYEPTRHTVQRYTCIFKSKPTIFTRFIWRHDLSATPWQKCVSNTDVASTTTPGIVQLNNTLTSTSVTQAATANAVKLVNDKISNLTNTSSLYNTKSVITTSNAKWSSPITGWARVTVIGGGGGGAGGYGDGAGTTTGGGGGDSGGYVTGYVNLQKGTTYSIVIGAGGAAGTSGSSDIITNRGKDGGNSSFGSITAYGGFGGFRGASRATSTYPGAARYNYLGQNGTCNSLINTDIIGVGGVGGGYGYGRGGCGATMRLNNTVTVAATAGLQGAVIIEYHS